MSKIRNVSRITIRNVENNTNGTKNSIQVTADTTSPVEIENGFNTTDTSTNTVDLTAAPGRKAKAQIVNHDNGDNSGVNSIVC